MRRFINKEKKVSREFPAYVFREKSIRLYERWEVV